MLLEACMKTLILLAAMGLSNLSLQAAVTWGSHTSALLKLPVQNVLLNGGPDLGARINQIEMPRAR